MDSHLHTQKKLSASSAPKLNNGFETRSFPAQAKSDDKKQPLDLKTELSKAERFGHNLSRVPVHATVSPLPTVQAKPAAPLIQREEAQEEESEGAQMKAEKVLHPPTQRKPNNTSVQRDEEEVQAKADSPAINVQREGEDSEGAEGDDEEIQVKADTQNLVETVKPMIQRQASPAASGPTSNHSMPPTVKSKMEQSFGTDFSDVSIHESPQAKSIGALAFTQGNRIHFAPGQYSPHSQSGQALLGHELTHVVQQRAGRVSVPTQSKGAPINADPNLESEADYMGGKAARGEQAQVPGASFSSRIAQRKAKQPIQNSTEPVQFFLPMLLPMIMPMIQPMLQPILQQVIGGVFGGGGAGGPAPK